MIVYIEDTLIENFLVTYLILNIVFSFVCQDKNKIRHLLASIFGAVVALLYPILNLNGILVFLLKMMLGYIITIIAYKAKTLKRQIFFFYNFYFCNSYLWRNKLNVVL